MCTSNRIFSSSVSDNKYGNYIYLSYIRVLLLKRNFNVYLSSLVIIIIIIIALMKKTFTENQSIKIEPAAYLSRVIQNTPKYLLETHRTYIRLYE